LKGEAAMLFLQLPSLKLQIKDSEGQKIIASQLLKFNWQIR